MADSVEATIKLKMGNPLEEETDVGPMINLEAAEKKEVIGKGVSPFMFL